MPGASRVGVMAALGSAVRGALSIADVRMFVPRVAMNAAMLNRFGRSKYMPKKDEGTPAWRRRVAKADRNIESFDHRDPP